VNNLTVQALVAAFAAKKSIVDEPSTRTAVTEVTTDRRPGRQQTPAGLRSAGFSFTCKPS